MSKAIGLTLTIAGLILAVWFVRQVMAPGPAPLFAFVVAAIAVAMVSVGVRYTFRAKRPKGDPKT